jgi:hypothetical protein
MSDKVIAIWVAETSVGCSAIGYAVGEAIFGPERLTTRFSL